MILKLAREFTLWAIFTIFIASISIPGSFWIDAGQTRIDDFESGSTVVEMINTRDLKRNFNGSYSVIVRDALTNQVVTEESSGIIRYSVDAQLPFPLTLEWWVPRTHNDIKNLEPGAYYMETCWSIYPKFLPKKYSCSVSDVFKVRENEDGNT